MSTTTSTEEPVIIFVANVQYPDVQGGSTQAKAYRTRLAAETQVLAWVREQLKYDELEIIEGEGWSDGACRVEEADQYSNPGENQFDVWVDELTLEDEPKGLLETDFSKVEARVLAHYLETDPSSGSEASALAYHRDGLLGLVGKVTGLMGETPTGRKILSPEGTPVAREVPDTIGEGDITRCQVRTAEETLAEINRWIARNVVIAPKFEGHWKEVTIKARVMMAHDVVSVADTSFVVSEIGG